MAGHSFTDKSDRSRCLMCGEPDPVFPEDNARFCSGECADAWEVVVNMEAERLRDERGVPGLDHHFYFHAFEPSDEDRRRRVIRGNVVVIRDERIAVKLLPMRSVVLGPVDGEGADE